jgi:hypothetical protein
MEANKETISWQGGLFAAKAASAPEGRRSLEPRRVLVAQDLVMAWSKE